LDGRPYDIDATKQTTKTRNLNRSTLTGLAHPAALPELSNSADRDHGDQTKPPIALIEITRCRQE